MDQEVFEEIWTQLAEQICDAIYQDPRIQAMKQDFLHKGFLSLEQKSDFITTSDAIKYEIIHKKFGETETVGYKDFVTSWQLWFKNKSGHTPQVSGKAGIVEHILFGSTPDPEEFLRNYS